MERDICALHSEAGKRGVQGEAVTDRKTEDKSRKENRNGSFSLIIRPVPRTSQRKHKNNRLLSRYLSKKTTRLPSVMLVAASELDVVESRRQRVVAAADGLHCE